MQRLEYLQPQLSNRRVVVGVCIDSVPYLLPSLSLSCSLSFASPNNQTLGAFSLAASKPIDP
jgi:hypothetical protein